MPRQVSHIVLRGGLDLISSPLTVDPGRLWYALNLEPVESGYRRILGYERFDGRPRPSDAEYWILGFDGMVATAPTDGATITAASGGTAVVLATVGAEYVLGEVDGTFADDDALTVGMAADAAGTANGAPRRLGAESIALDEDYRDLAAAHRRTLIAAVPGSGRVRGVWYFGGSLYAFRDNAGVTAGAMHRATAAGWTEVALGHHIAFDAGVQRPTVGDTLTGATSGATARLGAVVLDDATVDLDAAWDGTREGTFWLTGYDPNTAAFADDESLQVDVSGTMTTVAVANGAASANTLPVGGRYEFRNHNFYGQTDTREMYGVNGVGPAFHFDGTQFVSISTPHDDDRPVHLFVHAQHLMLGYRGGSIVGSEPGNPDGYNASLRGASELATGQEILGFSHAGPNATWIIGDDHMQGLFGHDVDDFQIADQSDPETGGVEWTVQNIGRPIYMDNRGVRAAETTERFGNFVIGTLTADIQPWLDIQRRERNVAVGSLRIRSSDQYRLFFESGIGIVIYLGRQTPEITFVSYGEDSGGTKILPRCSVSAEDADRIERVYFGADNGFVYEDQRGRSFDGRAIESYGRFPLNHTGMPSRQKRFFGADIHCQIDGRARLGLSAVYDDGRNPEQGLEYADIFGGGGFWDEALFDEFIWDAPLSGYHSYDMRGIGRNVSILLLHESAKAAGFTLNGVSLHWAPRRAED